MPRAFFVALSDAFVAFDIQLCRPLCEEPATQLCKLPPASLSEMKNNCSRGLRSFLRGASGEDKQLVFSLVVSTSVCEAAHRNSSTFVMVGFFVAVVVTVVFFAVVVVVIAIEGY